MKMKYYPKTLLPICAFAILFRVLEIMYAIEPSTGFYYNQSIIPIVFGIYMLLVVLFFLSGIVFTKTESKPQKKRLSNIVLPDKILMLLTAVCVLASGLKSFLLNFRTNPAYGSLNGIFSDFPVYVLLSSVLASVFLVIFVTDPVKAVSGISVAALSVFFPVYYSLRIFQRVLDLDLIVSKAYGTYMFYFLGFLILSFMNLSKILSGTICKKQFSCFGLCSVFFASVHLVEFVMYFLPGNPYSIAIGDDLITYVADLLCSVMILRFVLLINKKHSGRKADAFASDDDTPEKIEEETPESLTEAGAVSEPVSDSDVSHIPESGSSPENAESSSDDNTDG